MSTCIINPRRNQGEPKLPPIGILAVNPADSTSFAGTARRFGLQQHRLFHSQLYSNDAFFLAGPAVGAPMATICLEKLIALGARRIVLYGWCGSLIPSLATNDLFIPTKGLSEEGTSGHYPVGAVPKDDSLRLGLVDALAGAGYSIQHGTLWTTDAVFRETKEKIVQYGAQGIMAVDMEYTALNTVAAFRQVSFAAVLLVSDELFHPEWIPCLHHKQFRARSRRLLENLCSLLHTGEIS